MLNRTSNSMHQVVFMAPGMAWKAIGWNKQAGHVMNTLHDGQFHSTALEDRLSGRSVKQMQSIYQGTDQEWSSLVTASESHVQDDNLEP